MLALDHRITNLQRLQNTITIIILISARTPTCILLDENLRTSLYLVYSTEPTIPGLGVSHRVAGLDLVCRKMSVCPPVCFQPRPWGTSGLCIEQRLLVRDGSAAETIEGVPREQGCGRLSAGASCILM